MTDIQILKKLISYKTDANTPSFKYCNNYIASLFKKNGWEVKFIPNKDGINENLIAVLNGKLSNISEGLLLSGHIDTVETSEENWKTKPLKLTIKNNAMYGLGIADMKYFTASVLANLDKINKLNLKKPLIFCITNDEETMMQGINAVTNYFKLNNIKPEFAIIGEPNNLKFSNSNKSFFEFETNIYGKSCHSSNPKFGINSIYIMSKFVSFLENLCSQYENTTINVGVINGGTQCNIVPDFCTVRWDIRTFSKDISNKIINEANIYLTDLSELYNSTFNNKIVLQIPAFENIKNKYFELLINKYKFEEKPYQASTEAGFFQNIGINCTIFGAGNIGDAHSIDENLNVNDFRKYQNLLCDMIKDICC